MMRVTTDLASIDLRLAHRWIASIYRSRRFTIARPHNGIRHSGVPFVMIRQRLGAVLLLCIWVCAGCGSATSGSPPTPSPAASGSAATPTASPTATSAPQPSCADRVLALMTLDQRIGQLFELGLAGDGLGATESNMIRNDHIGSVWFVDRSYAGVAGIRAVAIAVQSQVSSASTANVRFFIAANQEGGLIQAMQGPGFSRIPTAAVVGTLARRASRIR